MHQQTLGRNSCPNLLHMAGIDADHMVPVIRTTPEDPIAQQEVTK
jgi:hypothetical protein